MTGVLLMAVAKRCFALMAAPALVIASPGAVSSAAAQQAPPAALVRENATVKLTDHVWVIPDFNVGGVPNVGIIVGGRATMVVDTGLGPRNGETIVREMNKVSRNTEVYVATTHYHPEHTLGTSAFKGAKVVMPRIQQQDMRELGKEIQDMFASRSALNADLLNGVTYPTGDILFEREQRIDLGGVNVRLFTRGPTPLHTRGDTMIVAEEDRVLFTGDVVMGRRFLAASTNPPASITLWMSTLDELAALRPVKVVPSHGDLGDATLITRDRGYLQAVQTRVGELKKQGKTVDEAVQAVAAEIAPRYPEWGPPSGSAATARAAFAEASGAPLVRGPTTAQIPHGAGRK
jgi:glyoxylase-like metal-dependent hydrolase (beta-lactamase superfamily II)